MGLEQVKSEILEEARQEADEIVKEAEQKAEEIISSAEQEAEEIRKRTDEEIEEQKQSMENRIESSARMEARQLKLGKKQQKIDETFEKFRERLSGLDGEERETFVENCLDRTGFEAGSVKGSGEFADAVEAEELEFEEIDREGIIIESENGERRQDFTFDRVVENLRQNNRKEVAEKLFR